MKLALALLLTFGPIAYANELSASSSQELSSQATGDVTDTMDSSREPERVDAVSEFLAEKKVRAIDFTCSEVQSMLQKERALNILSGRHGWGVVHYYYAADCGLKYASSARVRVADRRSCFAGYVCLRY